MKPASRTPLGAIIIGEVLAETDLPKGAFSILPASRDGADLFTTDDRLKLLSFTGSPDVGWDLKMRSGKKKVVLELGGNAAVIVDADADLDDALERVIFGAFYQSGQSCIGVQRIIIHADVYDRFRDMLVARTKTLVAGDPKQRDTFIGPMIDVKEATRLETWINEAVAAGGTLLCGGSRDGGQRVRVGGRHRMSFRNFTTGESHGFGGEYRELSAGERLVYTDRFDDENLPGEMTVTVELKAVSVGTDVQIEQRGVPDVIPAEACYLSWQDSLRKLAGLVEPDIKA